MKVVKQPDGFWIIGVPGTPACGPYETKSEATEDMRGMARCFRNINEREFFTSEATKE